MFESPCAHMLAGSLCRVLWHPCEGGCHNTCTGDARLILGKGYMLVGLRLRKVREKKAVARDAEAESAAVMEERALVSRVKGEGAAADGESAAVMEERARVSKMHQKHPFFLPSLPSFIITVPPCEQLYTESAEVKVDAVREYLGITPHCPLTTCKAVIYFPPSLHSLPPSPITTRHCSPCEQLYTESAEAKVDAVREYLGTMLELRKVREKKAVARDAEAESAAVMEERALVSRWCEVLVGLVRCKVGKREMAWNPGDLVQAEDRAHRIGQANAVNVYYLHAPETIDDVIWSVVQHKLENLGQVMDGEQKQSLQVHKDPRHAAAAAALAGRKKGGGDEQQQGKQGSGKWGWLTHAGVTDGGVTVAGCGGGEEKKRQRTISEMFQPPS
ncbi:unnamed protein product [Closterium sp. NIES-53]